MGPHTFFSLHVSNHAFTEKELETLIKKLRQEFEIGKTAAEEPAV